MSPWGWTPERTQGIWRYGSPSLRPLVASAPWVTVLLLLMLLWFVGHAIVTAKGVLFDLPEAGLSEGEPTGPVALIAPGPKATLIFYDDSRYMMNDPNSLVSLGEHLGESVSRAGRKTILALVDRRVTNGELLKFVTIARKNGVEKVLFAEKKESEEE